MPGLQHAYLITLRVRVCEVNDLVTTRTLPNLFIL